MKKQEKIQLITQYLKTLIPNPRIELNYQTPFQLLVAVMMSAQTTDVQVNKVNEIFFQYLKEPKDVNTLGQEKIQSLISSIGFYKNKAKFIYQTGNILLSQYNSQVPDDIQILTSLPGVGIKTAKVVLSNLYDRPYLAVDTHVHRVLNRLGMVKTKLPEETDKKIDTLFHDDDKRSLHHLLVLFGRYHCKAQKPNCSPCPLQSLCSYKNKNLPPQ